MSKPNDQHNPATGSANRRQQRLEQETKARRKQNKIYWIVGLAFALVAAVVLFLNSGLFYRTATAVRIGDEKYSISDYNFYYQTTYYQFYLQMYSYYGSSTQYYMPSETELRQYTLESMTNTQALYNEAMKNGYELSPEAAKQLQDAMNDLESTAKQGGYANVSAYLRNNYGRGMTKAIYERGITRYLTASDYATYVMDGFQYTEEEIDAYYELYQDDYDTITYRYFYYPGSSVEDDPETEADETMTAEQAMAKAKEICQQVMDGATDEETFIALAKENATGTYAAGFTSDDAFVISSTGSNLDPLFATWALESDRQEGDMEVIESSTGVYCLYWKGRDKNEYETVNVRHILIMDEQLKEEDYETTEQYEAAVAAAKEAAYNEIDDIFNEWKSGEKTEESFAALADKYSEDSAVGGLYEQVYDGQMVAEFNDWCFDKPHLAGDCQIVYTEDYGYHLIYFVGYDDLYCDVLANTGLREAEYTTWETALLESLEAQGTWVLKLRA